MGRNPWALIEKQKEYAIENPITSAEDIKRGYPKRDFFEKLFAEAGSEDGDRYIPLSYYTKACAWASDYPWMYKRVMAYVNPGPLSVLPLEEYVLREFGCNLDTLVQLIADGWFVPLLNDREEYPRDIQRQIANLYAEADARSCWDIEPRYVNVVDRGLEARGKKIMDDERINEADGEDRVSIDATKESWKDEEPWSEIPQQKVRLHGVEHDDLQEYVVERAVKLRLADRVLNLYSEDGEHVTPIEDMVWRYNGRDGLFGKLTQLAGRDAETELARKVYRMWNQFGTPTYYCDMSGTVDMGPGPMSKVLPSSVPDTVSGIASSYGLNLIPTPLRPVPPGSIHFWASDDVDLKRILAFGPKGIRQPPVRKRYRFLADRAEIVGDYYDEMLAGGDSRLDREVLDSAYSYEDVIDIHRAKAPTRTYPQIRQIATNLGDALVIGDILEPLLHLGPHRNLYSEAMEVFGNAITPGLTAVLVSFSQSTLRVPEWISEPPIDSNVVERDDIFHGDVWQVPYGNWANRMNQFRWITEKTLLNAVSPGLWK